ncbi:hypothetical protein FACS1894122_10370 [Alphaproteobacteria bacterium]|nr:hypothetical protein FACS1894122_10370 [Alphaproteobacteria bacterium]
MKLGKTIAICASVVVIVNFGIAEGMHRHRPSSSVTSSHSEVTTPITIFNGGKYTGGVNEYNRPDGQGTATYPDRSKYEGYWLDGDYRGTGTYTWADGAKYVGKWYAGKRDGYGTYTSADGVCKYEGNWAYDKKDGGGTMVYKGPQQYNSYKRTFGSYGDVYDGQWKNDKKEGWGTYTFASGEEYYGEYKDGVREGKGKLTFADGGILEGSWASGRPVKATYTSADGDKRDWTWNEFAGER